MDRAYSTRELRRHLASGKFYSVQCVGEFAHSNPVVYPQGKYILMLVSDTDCASFEVEHARSWIDAGASYICTWGPVSNALEETFDYASILPSLGQPLPFTLMTTSHDGDVLEDALWFAFYTAVAPNDLSYDFDTVIVVAETEALERRCSSWAQRNIR